MTITKTNDIAIIKSEKLILTDVQSALDLIGEADYHAQTNKIIIFKENIAEDFFDLSTRKLGEVLQKFVTYNFRLAIIGDFSINSSKALGDFIFESNKGKHIYFVSTTKEAV